VEFSEEGKWLVMERGSIEVVVNLGQRSLVRKTQATQMLLSCGTTAKLDDGVLSLSPDAVAILKREQQIF
ncbi:MAG: hypothetical protein K6T49_10710, partial [Acidobacterium ailaaui]|nr:hypothetical protein [Pseudacidobacterium ailaaui]